MILRIIGLMFKDRCKERIDNLSLFLILSGHIPCLSTKRLRLSLALLLLAIHLQKNCYCVLLQWPAGVQVGFLPF